MTSFAAGRVKPGQVIYEVNCDVDEDVAEDFLCWLRPHVEELLELEGFESAEIMKRETPKPKPLVVFVLGGPGAGKGTQCQMIEEDSGKEICHISAGDCLRAERNNPNSEHGALINDCIANGKLVPVDITVTLILKAMNESGKNKFLIDGFPRNQDNVLGWQRVAGPEKVTVAGVLVLDCPEGEKEKRLLKRGEDAGANRRKDDNSESIRKRFKTHIQSTKPVIDMYDMLDLVTRIRGDRDKDEVFADVKGFLATTFAKFAPKKRVLLTCAYRVDTREHLEDYFTKHAARLRGDGLKRFAGKFDAHRRILKVDTMH